MKVFLVIYTLNSIIGVAGPLPYTMEECGNRANDLIEASNESFKTEPIQTLSDGRTVTSKDVEVRCEQHNTRPEMGDTK